MNVHFNKEIYFFVVITFLEFIISTSFPKKNVIFLNWQHLSVPRYFIQNSALANFIITKLSSLIIYIGIENKSN
jgi:hypothetical protein